MYKTRLKSVRNNNGILQKDIAKNLGISDISYTNYENEYYIMPLKYLNEATCLLNVSIDYILEFSNIKEYKNAKREIDLKLAGTRLKELRKENKLSQTKLSEILNCSYGTVAGYESGRYIIATPFLYEICKKYKISADYLLGKVDEPKYIK